eukprot:CAMPEP_0113273332 /NCGR_PEP_ID=MMETSP0008_2-20120614/23792_1 /TAXON_ID=97485 /ORGANISM="Prymnesium parvum" /LENGTH=39 /DNA_ID=CAMNT_0000122837 /DNA_START=382 /DNA_END=501 /DNA_ORIENTATION=+ /assembly_acc=CAM_ASM_000153
MNEPAPERGEALASDVESAWFATPQPLGDSCCTDDRALL